MLDRSTLLAVAVILVSGCATQISGTAVGMSKGEVSVSLSDGRIVESVRTISTRPSDAEMTILGISIEVSTLDDVEKKIGKGTLFHEGEAGASVFGRCFKGQDGTVVAFESGEMGAANILFRMYS